MKEFELDFDIDPVSVLTSTSLNESPLDTVVYVETAVVALAIAIVVIAGVALQYAIYVI